MIHLDKWRKKLVILFKKRCRSLSAREETHKCWSLKPYLSMHGLMCGFYMDWLGFLRWPVDLYADKMTGFFQIAYLLTFALCLSVMMWCQYVEIVMACSVTIIWLFPACNVSNFEECQTKMINETQVMEILPIYIARQNKFHNWTYHIFFPIAHFCIDQMLQ